MKKILNLYLLSVTINVVYCILRDFGTCHDDFNLKPPDGVLKDHTFTWLGFAQYLHVTTGLPHHSKAPRVVLIHKQFVIGTATDMLRLPKNYKLCPSNPSMLLLAQNKNSLDVKVCGCGGHVIFGDYERDEVDCGLTRTQTKMGIQCQRAYIEMPVIDITPHPEYTRFGVGNSIALVKLLHPVKSHYMIPICLPSLSEREKKRRNKVVFMVDYLNSVPRDFDTEKMAKKSLKLFTHKDCRRHRLRSKLGSEGVTHVLCSSGCGVRPGAPLVSHAMEGPFHLIGIAAGGAPCVRRAMRKRLNREPPLYIDVYPYMSWIINFISGHVLPRPYPDNFMLMEGGPSIGIHRQYLRLRKKQKQGWRARTFVVGDYCFKSYSKMARTAFFYSETFDVNADPPAKMNVIMKLSAGIETTIVCAKLIMPNRLVEPVIEGVGGYNITVTFNTLWFPYTFYFSLGLHGKNTTRRDFTKWIYERNRGFW